MRKLIGFHVPDFYVSKLQIYILDLIYIGIMSICKEGCISPHQVFGFPAYTLCCVDVQAQTQAYLHKYHLFH